MNDKLDISAFVINYNGGEYLDDCLSSLLFCRQLVVVDKGSTDGSVEIIRSHTDELYHAEWTPVVEDTRPLALEKCRCEWVLFLDADEMVDRDLVKWLEQFVATTDQDAAAILFRNYYFGHWSRRQRNYPVRHVRLFRRGAGSFQPVIHTSVSVPSGRIYRHREEDGGAIIHHGYRDLSQWLEKVDRYTGNTCWETPPLETGKALFDYVDSLLRQARERFDVKGGDDFEAVTHLLFFLYKTVEELRHWESARDVDVEALCRRQRIQVRETVIRYWLEERSGSRG